MVAEGRENYARTYCCKHCRTKLSSLRSVGMISNTGPTSISLPIKKVKAVARTKKWNYLCREVTFWGYLDLTAGRKGM